ncbi:zinc finger protein ZAT11-like [Hibiscus syriacus]|uniref:Zinc finger protein ZAT11-like n=1 Tax=Hibiscus syriacus TaxID=106335 RepID=A0A6A2ZCR4_HIBSY|nr:zinc finger protein ZAT11-like [Hibiscus syriacus]
MKTDSLLHLVFKICASVTIEDDLLIQDVTSIDCSWNWNLLHHLLTPVVLPAYASLNKDQRNARHPIWNQIWKLAVPERVRCFIWLASHNKLLSSETRCTRGLSHDASCSYSGRCTRGYRMMPHRNSSIFCDKLIPNNLMIDTCTSWAKAYYNNPKVVSSTKEWISSSSVVRLTKLQTIAKASISLLTLMIYAVVPDFLRNVLHRDLHAPLWPINLFMMESTVFPLCRGSALRSTVLSRTNIKNQKRSLTVVAVGDVSADGTNYLIAGAAVVALVGNCLPNPILRKDTCPECDGAGLFVKLELREGKYCKKGPGSNRCARCNGLGKLNQIDK